MKRAHRKATEGRGGRTGHFSFADIEAQLGVALEEGYRFVTSEEYARGQLDPEVRTVVLRIDIDGSCKKAGRLAEVFQRLGIRGTFFVRLHAPEYNPFSFEDYRVLAGIVDSGHEVGYHSEIVDQAAIWSETPEGCLRRDVEILNRMLGIEVVGVASHGGRTGLNNLDFWRRHSPQEFGLLYEAYERSERFDLFGRSFYVSDSEWTQWKCYENGRLLLGDRRTFGEHARCGHPLLYLLIHPDTYYDRHFYE